MTVSLLFAGAASAQQLVDMSQAGPAGTAIQWTGAQANARAGSALLSADMSGDVNRLDLVVGAPGAGPNGEGQTYILFMGPDYATGSVSAAASATMTGEAAGDRFGAAVAAGMVVRQRTSPLPPRDLVVSAPGAQGGRGAVYLFPGPFTYGDARAAGAAPFRVVGAPGDHLGTALVAADIDGDGYRDIVMSAPGTGRIYIVYGGPSLSGTRDLSVSAADVTITLAAGAVTLASGDFNGDGMKDLAIGTPAASSGAGAVAIVLGKARASIPATLALASADALFTGIDAGDQAGAAMQAVDMDADGLSDLVIGAPGAAGPSNLRAGAGEVYVLWGGSTFATSRSLTAANLTIYGAAAGHHLGTAIEGAHLRRDLEDDLLMLAPGASAAGDIDVVYGGLRGKFGATVDLATQVDRVLRGDPAGAPLQTVITSEVTGKGEDVIAGAPTGSSSGLTANGTLYVVYSPALQLNPANASVTVAQGATATATINIRNIGSMNIAWAARPNSSWMAMNPAAGTSSVSSPGTMTVTVTPGNLPTGTYHGGFAYLSTSADLVWVDTGAIDMVVTAGTTSGGGTTNLFGLPSDPDEGSPNGVVTNVGTNVTVVPIRDFLVRFANVTQAGRTTVTVQQGAPGSAGMRATPWVYTVRTTAVFSGPVTVAQAFENFTSYPNDMRILNGTVDVTTSVDTSMHAVYGSVSGIPATFTVVEDRRRFVTLTKIGLGTGTLTASPSAIACGDNCMAFVAGTSVTLTPAPTSDSELTGWGGACSTSGATCTLTMPADRTTSTTVVYALNKLVVPSAVNSLVRPIGTIGTTTPRFVWLPTARAKSYLLWVADMGSGTHVAQPISAADASCLDGVSTCYARLPSPLALGAGRWWVQASNGAGAAAWSIAGDYTVTTPDQAPPDEAYLATPSTAAIVTTSTPAYTWQATPTATSYYLWVSDGVSARIQQWYAAADVGCPSAPGTCVVTPATPLGAGTYRWWVQTRSAQGYGPWSLPNDFTIVASATVVPGQTTLIAPSGTIGTATPAFSWRAVPYVTQYFVWIDDASGNRLKHNYTPADAGCAGGTGTCQVSPGLAFSGAGTWWVKTINGAGDGGWTPAMQFNYVSPTSVAPGPATLISPNSSTTLAASGGITYTWNAVAGSTWYYLWVSDSTGGPALRQWYTAAQAGCSAGTGTCSVTSSVTLATGAAKWWIQTWNPTAYGPWSAAMSFSAP